MNIAHNSIAAGSGGLAPVRRARPAARPIRDPGIFWLSFAVIATMFTLNGQTLNQVMNYTISGGSFFSKFHPATYLALPLAALVLADSGGRKSPLDRYLLRFLGVFFALMAYLAVTGKGAAASIVVDIWLTPIILLLALSRLSMEDVRKLAALFVWIAVADGLAVLLDFLRGVYTFPVFSILLHEDYFRPSGFSGHPTQVSFVSVVALYFVLAGAVRSFWRRALTLFFLLTIVLCKERTPMALAAMLVLMDVYRPFVPRPNDRDGWIDIAVIILIPLVVGAAYLSGAFDRFLAVGVWDKSTQSRFDIYQVLLYFTPDQLYYGIKDTDVEKYFAQHAVNSGYVESAFLIAAFAAGIPYASLFMATCLAFYWRFVRRGFAFAVFVLVSAAMGNAFMAKGMVAGSLTLLGYYLWRRKEAVRSRQKLSPPVRRSAALSAPAV